MKRHFFRCLLLSIPAWLLAGAGLAFAQVQDFESDFQRVSYPDEFLPNWVGNEVSGGSSRIFQSPNLGRDGSRALAVQPISTFDGKIWIKLSPDDFEDPELVFFAKSARNGNGTRPALVWYSWGKSLDGPFTDPVQIGGDAEFSNENQEWREFTIPLPDSLKNQSDIVFSLDIRYGPGGGTAARWLMDDFEFGDFVTDETPPHVTEVKGYDASSVILRFSEKLDSIFSNFLIAYELEQQNPGDVKLMQDSIVILTFPEQLEPMKRYSLSIRQLADLEGNFLQDTTVQFTFSDPTDIPRKALIINELMPAPKADQDLPNVEYIELFHAGENELRLAGVRLSNSRSGIVLREQWLQPGEFLILAPENQAALFHEFGMVLPLRSWPTLLNSGDEVTLVSASGQEIDRIGYTTASWGGSDFANGGYSLEVPRPDFLCNSTILLRPSIHPDRGTPGSLNSIYSLDSEWEVPTLASVDFVDSLQIRMVLSGPVLPDLMVEHISFSPSLSIDSLWFFNDTETLIVLKTPALFNERYEMKIVGIVDCLGNLLSEQLMTIILSEAPAIGDLIINELLFNPRTGDPKFVELKNASQKFLRLENWALSAIGSSGSLDPARVFGRAGLILGPGEYLAITTDSSALKLAYPRAIPGTFVQIPSLPSYPISGGTVVLISPDLQIVEKFTYNEDLHHPLLRDSKGVSLERVSPLIAGSDPSNWQSASGNEGFATPGRRNSQAISGDFESGPIRIDPEVFDPQGSTGASFTTISYQLDQPGWVGTFKLYSAAGQLIQTLAQNQVLGTKGLFTWTGTDSSGKLVRAGYYVLVVELYEPGGKTDLIKKTLVVATTL
jgi:hypothetical protein